MKKFEISKYRINHHKATAGGGGNLKWIIKKFIGVETIKKFCKGATTLLVAMHPCNT